jgi:hypothetical protein
MVSTCHSRNSRWGRSSFSFRQFDELVGLRVELLAVAEVIRSCGLTRSRPLSSRFSRPSATG